MTPTSNASGSMTRVDLTERTAAGPLAQLAREGDLKTLEERWLAAVEQGTFDYGDGEVAVRALVARAEHDLAGALAAMAMQGASGDVPEEALRFGAAAALLLPRDADARAACAALHARAGRKGVDTLLAPLTKVSADNLKEVVARVAGSLRIRPGSYVKAADAVAPERVVSIRDEDGAFVVTDGSGERAIGTEQVGRGEAVLLPDDDFRALLKFDLPALKERADRDPAGLVRAALRSSNNRLEFTDLKKLMARAGIAQTSFTRWWSKARGLVERDPMIQVWGDKDPTLILRTDPITHEEELAAKLLAAASPIERMQLVLEYVIALDEGHEVHSEFLGKCGAMLAELARSAATPAPVAVAAAALHEDVAKRLDAGPEAEEVAAIVLARIAEVRDLPAAVGDEELSRRALAYLRARAEAHWPRLFADALPSAPGRLAESIARELSAASRTTDLEGAVAAILATPDRYADGLLWLWKSSTSGALEKIGVHADGYTCTLALLRLMNRWARSRSRLDVAHSGLLQRMRSAVGANNCRAVDRVLDALEPEQAGVLHREIEGNQGITEQTRMHVGAALIVRFKEHIHGRKEMWEEDVIYVSPAGLQKRQLEYENLVNVEMVKNSAAIGHAAGFGDLSENAEFTAALEQRDFLSRRANDIAAEIAIARPIPFDEISTDKVNVGTRIRVRDLATGRERTMAFLGPWDADLDSGIYSYLAPFARIFLGHAVGDVVEANMDDVAGRFQIESIEKA